MRSSMRRVRGKKIDAKAKKLAEERKAKAAKAKLLLDYLEEEYSAENARPRIERGLA